MAAMNSSVLACDYAIISGCELNTKELNDKKRLAISGANFARAYTVQFGTCKFPENFTGCQDLAKQKITTPLLYSDTVAATITTVEIDNPGEPRWCGQKIESRQRLSSCRKYLIDSSRFVPENYKGRGHGGSWREEFPRCCDELERINERCRCEAIQKVTGEQQETGELQGREMREMKLTAQSLPGLCRISPQYCDLENAFTL